MRTASDYSVLHNIDWVDRQRHWMHAHGAVEAGGVIKTQPDDFLVEEQMPVTPAGEGEHVWLWISKRLQNTESVARQLARFSGVSYKDVSYSGLKDYRALTWQWFSIRLPIDKEPEWSEFAMDGVTVERRQRHTRKLKRGTHDRNRFRIRIRELQGEPEALGQKLDRIAQHGVPNYFGPQRFGNRAGNLPQAVDLLVQGQNVRNRNLRSILISSARAWLFNELVSARIDDGSWETLWAGEPANLDGSGSVFNAEGGEDEQRRLQVMDIHPTAPLWGRAQAAHTDRYSELHRWEQDKLQDYLPLMSGLESAGANYQRRPIRCRVLNLEYSIEQQTLTLEFELRRGQFATSVLRELVNGEQVLAA